MNALYRLTGWRIFAPRRTQWGENTAQWSEVDWDWFNRQPRPVFQPAAVDWVVGALIAALLVIAVAAMAVLTRPSGFAIPTCIELQNSPNIELHCTDAITGQRH